MTRDAGVVLAAGAGVRFGGPKAPYVWEDERLVDRAVRVLRDAGCDPVVVVLGAWRGEVPAAVVVENPGWGTGMGSSLKAGLEHLASASDADRAIVTLVDLPGLTSVAVARVCSGGHGADDLAQATYDGTRGHPVVLGRTHWAAVSRTADGDRGARDYLAHHEVRLVEVGDVASGDDLDLAPEDAQPTLRD